MPFNENIVLILIISLFFLLAIFTISSIAYRIGIPKKQKYNDKFKRIPDRVLLEVEQISKGW